MSGTIQTIKATLLHSLCLSLSVSAAGVPSSVALSASNEGDSLCVHCELSGSEIDVPKEAHEIIIGKDDRERPTANEAKEFSGVGKIDCSSRDVDGGTLWSTTAWLALERHILVSNKHAYMNSADGKSYIPEKDCVFTLVFRGREVGYSIQPGVTMGELAYSRTNNPSEDAQYADDWAVATLATQVPQDFAALGIAIGDKEWLATPQSLVSVGFHGDKGSENDPFEQFYVSRNCVGYYTGATKRDPLGLSMRHTCDTFSRASGSPLIWRDPENNKLFVVGLHYGGPEPGDLSRNYNQAVRLDGRLYQAIRARSTHR